MFNCYMYVGFLEQVIIRYEIRFAMRRHLFYFGSLSLSKCSLKWSQKRFLVLLFRQYLLANVFILFNYRYLEHKFPALSEDISLEDIKID